MVREYLPRWDFSICNSSARRRLKKASTISNQGFQLIIFECMTHFIRSKHSLKAHNVRFPNNANPYVRIRWF